MVVPNMDIPQVKLINANIRVLTNGAIFVQYQEDSKAKDGAFASWDLFIHWLAERVGVTL